MPPTNRYGLITIPAPGIGTVAVRYASLADRDIFNQAVWPVVPLAKDAANPGWWNWDVDAQGLADGSYEYEFVLDGDGTKPVPDPYADEITRFNYYRGVLHVSEGVRVRKPFRWNAAVEAGTTFPQNNAIVIYEMPLKWMTAAVDNPLVDIGTFEEVVFEHLDRIEAMGVNCIELLPIEDSPQTLNWGYGTRFFFAPDFDMGGPVDLKFFIQACHGRGIRVILDVVMAFFADECPLAKLADSWFEDSTRHSSFGGRLFLYDRYAYGTYFAVREFLYQMADFWVTEYHIDGFRIDDYPDIKNADFVQAFRNGATAASNALFPGKPFLVIAEDTNREFFITEPNAWNPGGGKVADAIWNFGFRDEVRALAMGSLNTNFGDASRTERVKHFLSKDGVWAGGNKFAEGYADLACAVNYATSHDVKDAPRMMNVILGPILQMRGLGDGGIANVAAAVDAPGNGSLSATTADAFSQAVADTTARVFGVFALIMTSVGIPMLLAGDEFGDVHDEDYTADNPKQQDPVQWARAGFPNNQMLQTRVGALIQLRTTHAALQRNEIDFFYFHPSFDQALEATDGQPAAVVLFGYCRTGGNALGSAGQVIVIANMCGQSFATYGVPNWPWGTMPITEVGGVSGAPVYTAATGTLTLAMNAFQVRVFQS